MLDLIIWILFGVFQGMMEWIPVSSEAFLFIFLTLLGIPYAQALALAILLHLGTSLAALIYYRKEYIDIIKLIVSRKHLGCTKNLLDYFIIAGGITLCLGYILNSLYESFLVSLELIIKESVLIVLSLVGLAMIFIGFFMRSVYKGKISEITKEKVSHSDSAIVGFFQAFSVFPGVSRSGVTISTLLLRRINQRNAVKLSFLIAPIVIIPATIYEIVFKLDVIFSVGLLQIVLAELSAFVVSLIAIEFMTKLTMKIEFSKFLILMGSILLASNTLLLLL